MRTLVLAYGTANAASTIYRYHALQSSWASQGHELDITPIKDWTSDFEEDLGAYDAIINQKALMCGRLGRRVFSADRPVFFDFDDAIWTRPRRPYSWWTQWRVNRRIRYWLSRVRCIFVANEYLATFAQRFNPRVTVVPMALDLEIWKPRNERPKAVVRIGWAGAPGNLWHLEKLGAALKRMLALCPAIQFSVFCGRRPDLDIPFEHVPFTPGKEVEFVSSLDIGLLPLQDDPYTLGKSPIKALQYMSCAVAVVGNARGAAAEILNPENSIAVSSDEEWVNALQRLVKNPAEYRAFGRAGRRFVERHHNLRDISKRLMNLLLAER